MLQVAQEQELVATKRSERLVGVVGSVLLVIVLLAWMPLFICMPPWVDNTWYDLCARTVLRGDVLYREIFWHGLPGMVWLQTAVRVIAGWSNEALRSFDLLVLAGIVCLLCWRMLPWPVHWPARIWTALILCIFYFSTSEWCHCQPDMWMLLPALVAADLRQRQVSSILEAGGQRANLGLSLIEGICWGAGCLIKPFVAVPAAFVWLASLIEIWPAGRNPRKVFFAQSGSMILGGVLTAGLAAGWLVQSGNWPYFLDSVLGGYGAEYFRRSATLRERFETLATWLWPWSIVHLLALPFAMVAVSRLGNRFNTQWLSLGLPPRLFAVFYLGWFLQGSFLQQHYMYHVVPSILLGLTVLAANRWLRTGVVVASLMWTLMCHPLLAPSRSALWVPCWRQGSTPAIRDQLSLEPINPVAPDWQKLEEVKAFLTAQGVRDREVTCYGLSTVHLYKEMDLRPSTRYILVSALVLLFPSHQGEICKAMYTSPQRFVVGDLWQLHQNKLIAEDNWPAEPFGIPLTEKQKTFFPWTEKPVARFGRYVVYQVRPEHRLQFFRP
jgi:hypothetical protein